MIVETAAGPVELDETGIPPELLPQARAWFANQVQIIARQHGWHWPATKDWIADYLRAELRERVQAGAEGWDDL